MARFSSGSSGRLGKRSRNASETASMSSWGSEVNILSDGEEVSTTSSIPKKRNREFSSKAASSSDEESLQSIPAGSTRGPRPKCFSRNAVLARQNRLKKKKYMEDLENELQSLRTENSNLKTSLKGYTKDVELVRKENIYLRNVLANSPEIKQLIKSINVNCGLPASTSLAQANVVKRPSTTERVPIQHPNVAELSTPTMAYASRDSCVPSSGPQTDRPASVRTTKRDFPIAADDVCLSLSAPEDEDDLGILFGDTEALLDLPTMEDADCLGFGPNAFGDWLDGDEPFADVGICLHVANKKVSIEFCSACNENALSYQC